MPFVFGIIGVILIVAGVRDTVTNSNPNLVTLVKADLTGTPNYVEWMVSIFIIGALGYIPQLRPISRGFMALVIIGLLWSNEKGKGAAGFFEQFAKQTTQAGGQDTSVSVQSGSASSGTVASTSATYSAQPVYSDLQDDITKLEGEA